MVQEVTYFSNRRFESPKFFEYLLVVHPNEEIFNQLREEKENFSSEYNVNIAKKTLPHITVANFLAKETMEETLIKWMHKIISNQQSFDVMINNFSGFPSSKTVYARIQNHEPFKQLATSLKTINAYINDNGFPNAKLINFPHMTIARSLQQHVYEKAMMDYSRKTFHAKFTVNELVLLKRVNQYDKCKQVSVFPLTLVPSPQV
ncbi:MAG: 2'-5' RNA ligase family protein [Parafilimonas sp.]|nr:2'-5' RNA ligase family protein [Parafilimonas sp.]